MNFTPMTMLHWEWVKEKAHVIRCEDTQGITALREGEIQAVAVFDSFTACACNVHMAIVNPFVIRAGFLNEIGRHLFVVCGRSRIFGLVPSNNPKALKLNRHIGMIEVARVPDALDEGVDYIVMEMEKARCRWIVDLEEVA